MVANAFNPLESAVGGVFQTWHYTFSDGEQQDLYKSLDRVVKSAVYDLVINPILIGGGVVLLPLSNIRK